LSGKSLHLRADSGFGEVRHFKEKINCFSSCLSAPVGESSRQVPKSFVFLHAFEKLNLALEIKFDEDDSDSFD
jgi:hypothetical protein